MSRGSTTHGMGLFLSFAICACTPLQEVQSDLDAFGFREAGHGTSTRSSGGIWVGNGLHDPTISRVDTRFGLSTPEGLAEHTDLIVDADYRDTVEYLVECALSSEQSITKTINGQTVVLEGLLGLAPEWEADACDEDCQQWVTSCLLARTNVSGQEIIVGLRSDHEAVGSLPTPGFPMHEASWYGNLFAPTPELYFCQGDQGAEITAQRQGRTCSTDGGCGFTELGSCADPGRCQLHQGTSVECSAGGNSYNTLSTYVAIPAP